MTEKFEGIEGGSTSTYNIVTKNETKLIATGVKNNEVSTYKVCLIVFDVAFLNVLEN